MDNDVDFNIAVDNYNNSINDNEDVYERMLIVFLW